MPRILIANIDNESMLADERALTNEFCLSSSLTAARMAWFAEPGDVVILPRDISPRLKEYIAHIVGYTPGSVTYMTPDWENGRCRPIRSRELLHFGIIERLSRLIVNRADWSVYPYCYERGTQQFAEALGLDGERHVKPFVKQGGAELLNDKRVFRSLAAGRGVSIAPGVVCANEWELERSVGSLIAATGAVIVKQDRHSGGLGNLIISRTDKVGGQGAMQVLKVTDDASLRDACRKVWEQLAYVEHTALIVESYLPSTSAMTAEFRIDPARNSVTFLNCGEVRQAPILSGLIMPASLPAYQAGKFIANATELARLCCDLGYDGLLNVDGIVTESGEVIVNEFNGRVGGCSHIHHILEAIAGREYGDYLAVVSHSRKISFSFDQALGLMADRNLGFDARSERGIIVTGEDTAATGVLEYLSVGHTRTEAMHLEAEFEALLDSDTYDERRGGLAHLARILSHLGPIKVEEPGEAARDDRSLLQGGGRKP